MITKKKYFIIVLSFLLFTQCNNKEETKEEKISNILTGKKKLVWNIHRNEWDDYFKSFDKTPYACEFYKGGYGFYISPGGIWESRGIKTIPEDSTWRMIDSLSIKFNYDTFHILSYNDTLFKLKAKEDTFYLIKEHNQKQSFYNGEIYTNDYINHLLYDR
ncbi:MAG: hypothetical protein WC984_01235 [Bacteroidales bacterium]